MEEDKRIPVEVNHLFAPLNNKLIELLKSLKEDDWERHTIARLWTVKDVASHLLDGNLRALSMQRDGYNGLPSPKTRNYKDVVKWLNNVNADWVKTSVRLSPQVIILLLEQTSKPIEEYFSSLEPFDKAIYPVDWAGQKESPNWLHVAREYTERWIHQQQIRNAVMQEGIITEELFYPFLDTLMQGLPHCFNGTRAKEGATVKITVSSDAGGEWWIQKEGNEWKLKKDHSGPEDSAIELDTDTAWKLFTKAIKPETAKRKAKIKGDDKLANVALNMVSVMA